MWIKHNKEMINTNYISRIFVARTKLKAQMNDGSEKILGEFRATKECEDIFQSITKQLLFEEEKHTGIIIRDTKVSKEKK